MGWWRFSTFVVSVARAVGSDDLSGRAAEMAYKFFLALFPFLIFLVAAGSFAADYLNVANPADELIDLVDDSLPDDVESLLRTQIENVTEEKNPVLLSFGILGAIWAASSGMGSIMKALNQVAGVKENRSLPRRYAMAVGLTIVGGLFIMTAVTLIILGQAFGRDAADELGLSSLAHFALDVVRYGLVVFFLLIAVGFIYWAAPAADLPFKFISTGAAVFVLTWLPFTYLFGLYVTNFGSYNATYGALGGVVVLLIWIYLSSFIFLLGYEVNAALAEREAEAVADAEEKAHLGRIDRLRRTVLKPLHLWRPHPTSA